jgi:hypothetical protein
MVGFLFAIGGVIFLIVAGLLIYPHIVAQLTKAVGQ